MHFLNASSSATTAPRAFRAISPAQALAVVGASALMGLTLGATEDWKVAAGLLLAGAFTMAGAFRPALFVAVFMIVRPLLDDASALSAGAPSANVGGFLGALLIAVTVCVIGARRRLYVPLAGRALMAVILVSVLAAMQAWFNLGSTVHLEPLSELIRLVALLALYVLAVNLFGTPAKARTLFLLVAVSSLVPAIYGIQQMLTATAGEDGEIVRASGTFVSPNALGAFLGLTALIFIFMPSERLSGWLRWGGLAVVLVALAGTYSRLGWVFLLLGLAVLGWRDRKPLVMAGIGTAVAVALLVPSIRERAVPFAAPANELAAGGGEGYESYDWRLDNWEGLLEKWRERPLFGQGLEATSYVNPRRLTEQVGEVDSGFKAHNMVVKILVEGGLVLLFVYLLFFGAVIASVARLRRRRWPLREHARLLFVLWILVMVIGIGTDDPLQFTVLMYAMLALTGAVEGAYRYWLREPPEEPDPDRELLPAPRDPVPAGAGSA